MPVTFPSFTVLGVQSAFGGLLGTLPMMLPVGSGPGQSQRCTPVHLEGAVEPLARMHPLGSVSPDPAAPGLIFWPHVGYHECKVEPNKGSIQCHFLLPLISSFPISLPLTISSFHSQDKQLSPWHSATLDLFPRLGDLVRPLLAMAPWTGQEIMGVGSEEAASGALRPVHPMPGNSGVAREIGLWRPGVPPKGRLPD